MGLDPGSGFFPGCFYASVTGMFTAGINTVVQGAGSGGWCRAVNQSSPMPGSGLFSPYERLFDGVKPCFSRVSFQQDAFSL